MQGGFPEGWAEKARAVLAEQDKDLLQVIDGQYRRGLIGAAERDGKLVAAAYELAPEALEALLRAAKADGCAIRHRSHKNVAMFRAHFMAAVIAVMILLAGSAPALALATPAFTDVHGHWAESYIRELADRGVVDGVGDGTFRPDEPLTRAQVVKLIAVSKEYQGVQEPLPFNDVAGHWVARRGYLGALLARGIIQAADYDRGLFQPDRGMPRWEVAVALVRALGGDQLAIEQAASASRFPDVPDELRGFVNAAAASGVITGYPDGRFHPNDVVTRGEATAMVSRFLRVQSLPQANPAPPRVSESRGYRGKVSFSVYSSGGGGKKDAKDVAEVVTVLEGSGSGVRLASDSFKEGLQLNRHGLAVDGPWPGLSFDDFMAAPQAALTRQAWALVGPRPPAWAGFSMLGPLALEVPDAWNRGGFEVVSAAAESRGYQVVGGRRLVVVATSVSYRYGSGSDEAAGSINRNDYLDAASGWPVQVGFSITWAGKRGEAFVSASAEGLFTMDGGGGE